VVHLRLASRSELFDSLRWDHLALHLDGHRIQLFGSGSHTIRMHSAGAKLELRIYRGQPLLGKGHTRTILHAGYQQHHHRCSIHGCASNLFVAGAAVQTDTTGYSHRLSAQYPVSSFPPAACTTTSLTLSFQRDRLLSFQDHRTESYHTHSRPHLGWHKPGYLVFHRTQHRHPHRLPPTPPQSLRFSLSKDYSLYHDKLW
jgi:hypothetical protein